MTENQKTTLGFQAEVSQLLQLMIHSLYSHKEIFLRELISNASDADDQLRFEAIANTRCYADDPDLRIRVDATRPRGTLTIGDNGIGMSREEAIAQPRHDRPLGHRGILPHLSGDQQKDAALIGQFGVGFYSAFIVAERVEVLTRKAGRPAAARACAGNPAADGEFTVETVDQAASAARRITLHLKADAREFADGCRLRALIRRYSDHIGFPVRCARKCDAAIEHESAANRGRQRRAPVDAAAHRDHRRGIPAVLSAPRARLHRSAGLEPQQRRGQARVHEPAVPARRARPSICGTAMPRAA